MTSNKVNGKLDFRNMTHSQFSSAQVLKSSFSELQSALKVYSTNPIVKEGYTHFVQTLNANSLPTHVEYWQALAPRISQLTFVADVSGSLRDTYILLEEYQSKRTVALHCVVGGTGTAPNVADVEIAVTFEEDDSASVVAFAFLNAINNNLDYFSAKRVGSIAFSNKINLEFLQFGESDPIDLGTTGFSSSVIEEGASKKVGEVYLEYDAEGSPIFNGSTLKGLLYNPYTASFDVERDQITVDVATIDLVSKEPVIYNLDMPVGGTEYSQVLPLDAKRFQINVRGHISPYTVGFTSGGTYLSKSYGVVYEETGLILTASSNTLYFTANKDDVVMEIIVWK